MRVYNYAREEWCALDDHQLEALDDLLDKPRFILNWEMGLGKTLTVLTHILETKYERVLIVAPNNVATTTWPDEIDEWQHTYKGLTYSVITGDERERLAALNEDVDIHLVGAHNISWLVGQFIKKKSRKWVGSLPYDLVVIDELTMFKNSKSARFHDFDRALNKQHPNPPFRIGLTGTLTPNGEIDLFAQLKLIDGGARLGKGITEFTDRYIDIRKANGIPVEFRTRPGAKKIITEKISDIVDSRNTRDYVDLPELIVVDEMLDFSRKERELYDYFEREYVVELLSGESLAVRTPSDLSNKLQQLTSGAVYTYAERSNFEVVNTLKLDVLGELFEDYPDDNFLIIFKFRHEVDRVLERFPWVEVFKPGSVKRWNNGEIRALLGHPASMGHGLNMQFGGRRMVMLTPPWSSEQYSQVVTRIMRPGLKFDMYLHRLFVRGTRDVKVRARLSSRMKDQQFLMDEVKELKRQYEKDIQEANRLRKANGRK